MLAHPHEGLDDHLAAALNHELSRHARLLHVMKSTMAAYLPEGLDVAAFPLLMTLVRCGARRQGELADMSMLDPSTVSRHVAQLARAGYVQRRADPQDGRAVQLVATDEGERVAAGLAERRHRLISEALAHWEPGDVEALVALMARLNDDLDAFRPQLARAFDGVPPARGPVAPPTASPPDPRSPDQETA